MNVPSPLIQNFWHGSEKREAILDEIYSRLAIYSDFKH
jgi:hypothetical protein